MLVSQRTITSGDIVFDISIGNNDDSFGIYTGIFEDFVKILKICFNKVFIFVVYCIERKLIRKIIY